ncbi:MAG: 2-hydroxymuconic semialdehyde dehydrogenase [Bacteroidetes bacterium]|nr:MAG: 2-hydroxymuconic semialdehyde dehydrogenase [Bacteroidota bacterium]PTM14182.1 MAG: 2-hydroxymuconic semialdehyde dehydrogenase [Bacteroidota bacterium]
MRQLSNYINGTFQPAHNGRYLPVYDPSRGQVYVEAPDSDEADVAAAMAAAQAAFPGWAATSVEERFEVLMKIVAGIESRAEELALAESLDNGKPCWLAQQVDIPRAAANFRFFAQAITQFAAEAHDMGSAGFNYTLRRPLGVVVCISPWNLPLYLFTWKIAPALAAGNTVLAKPSEITPLTAFLLAEICQTAGLPAGVLNILHGLGPTVGAALTAHPQVKAISFTGSTLTGAAIARVAAPQFKKLSLELGGKNPNIIFADCDYEKMLATTLRSSFSNQGQICLCGSRIFVERSLYERFKTDFVQRVKALRVGPPLAADTQIGAVVSQVHYEKVLAYIDLAKAEGGTILCGGAPVVLAGEFAGGWYLAPTVIEGLSYDCRTNQEEIFGPVVTLQPFDTEAEVLAWANSTTYGLSATIWTQHLNRAHQLSAQLEAGIVWINTWLQRDLRTPFGGTKNSGVGREGGYEALRFFTEPKNICVGY